MRKMRNISAVRRGDSERIACPGHVEPIVARRESYRATLPKEIIAKRLQAAQPGPLRPSVWTCVASPAPRARRPAPGNARKVGTGHRPHHGYCGRQVPGRRVSACIERCAGSAREGKKTERPALEMRQHRPVDPSVKLPAVHASSRLLDRLYGLAGCETHHCLPTYLKIAACGFVEFARGPLTTNETIYL